MNNKIKYFLVIAFGILMILAYLVFNQFSNTNNAISYSYSDEDKVEIEKFLSLYPKDQDALKHKVALHLIDNWGYHKSLDNYNREVDSNLIELINTVDSLYYELVKGKGINDLLVPSMADSIKNIAQHVLTLNRESKIQLRGKGSPEYPDRIFAETLHKHLEHSFQLREDSPMVAALTFDEFCDYILPPQARFGRYIRKSNQELYHFMAKYVIPSDTIDVPESVRRYRLTVLNFRKILGDYPLSYKVGFEELFFKNVPGWDCYDVSNFAMAFLNSVGIPTATEYNVAYKMLQGTHSRCVIIDKTRNYSPFSIERMDYYPILTTNQFEEDNGLMNIFRLHFSAQKDAPVFLKAKNEFIPEGLSSPLIEDVTSLRVKTQSLTIPFPVKTKNKLAYLATFNSQTGLIPVTWGIINKKEKSTTFENVMPDRLYFPVYYDGDKMTDFDSPFMFVKDNSSSEDSYLQVRYNIHKSDNGKKETVITRKFPRKSGLHDIARKLVGTTVIASNDSTFKTFDTLYTLDFVPTPYLQDVELNNDKAYQYYRIVAPKNYPWLSLSEIQFLTNRSYNYPNTIDATPLPIFKSILHEQKDSSFVRILEDNLDIISKWPQYDGDMTTSVSAHPYITLKLKRKQVVNKIRLAPINADNGIKVNNEYVLMTYHEGIWNNIEIKIAEYNYLAFNGLSKNTLYWLKNNTVGKEEAPFVINDAGDQVFIYN